MSARGSGDGCWCLDADHCEQFYEAALRGGSEESSYFLGRLHAKQRKGVVLRNSISPYEQRLGMTECSFNIGDIVHIQNLQSSTAVHLNGCMGEIVAYVNVTGRFGVEVQG